MDLERIIPHIYNCSVCNIILARKYGNILKYTKLLIRAGNFLPGWLKTTGYNCLKLAWQKLVSVSKLAKLANEKI